MGHFPGRLPVPKVKRELRVLALPPNEVLSQLQFCRAYKDSQRGHRLRTLTLDAMEFLRCLLLHVPPHGFHRLRHFGFLANRVRQAKLAQCRALLGQATRLPPRETAVDLKTAEVTRGEPGAVCPVCQHGRLQLVHTVYRQPAVWNLSLPAPGLDTS
jgi:hypothetical protein